MPKLDLNKILERPMFSQDKDKILAMIAKIDAFIIANKVEIDSLLKGRYFLIRHFNDKIMEK